MEQNEMMDIHKIIMRTLKLVPMLLKNMISINKINFITGLIL